MTIPEMIAIGVGFYVEIFWLLRQGDPVTARLPNLIPNALPPRLRERLTEYRLWLWAAIIILIAFAYEQLPFGDHIFMQLGIALDAMAVTMLLVVLYYGVLGHAMLPKVNLQKMFIVNLVVLLFIFFEGYESWPLWLLLVAILPTLALCYLAIWPRKISLTMSALLYFWYLLTLLALTFQNIGDGFFEATSFNAFEAFIFAAILVFLCLHVLLALRFLVIVMSLILPRNRPLLTLIMPHIIQDDVMPRRQVVLLLLFAIVALGVNQLIGIAPTLTLANLIVLGIVQYDAARKLERSEADCAPGLTAFH